MPSIINEHKNENSDITMKVQGAKIYMQPQYNDDNNNKLHKKADGH